MANLDYRLEDGRLIIRELPAGNVVRCDAFEAPVLKVLPLATGDGCLVLLDSSATKKPTFENLFKVGPDGSIDWRARLPDSHDAFVGMIDRGDHIEARTWNGLRVEIDLENGQTRNARFVK